MEEEFDLSQFKKVDENGEAQPIEVGNENTEGVEETKETENTEEEAPVAEASSEETSEEKVEESTESNEEQETSEQEDSEASLEDSPETVKLFEQLDGIAKDLSGGKVDKLEDFFDEYKRMRDSSGAQFKDDFIKKASESVEEPRLGLPFCPLTKVAENRIKNDQI